MNYDVIGDLHGDAVKLEVLLARLGYRNTAGAWRHANRQAVFVGDFIDRGSQQKKTCEIVRRMTDSGSAQAVMGNHEFNAIAWHTPAADLPGEYLRRHNAKNRAQHTDFLNEYEGTAAHDDIIGWFKSLPLWLDLGDIRVIHAQWHQAYMDELAPRLLSGARLSEDVLEESSHKGSMAFRTIEGLIKGLEVPLVNGSKLDQHGVLRSSERVRWWEQTDLHQGAGARAHTVPTFFGHYGLEGTPCVLHPQLACVDYYRPSNPLVAYQWDGEPVLEDHRFVRV
jgi:hypothetical protein